MGMDHPNIASDHLERLGGGPGGGGYMGVAPPVGSPQRDPFRQAENLKSASTDIFLPTSRWFWGQDGEPRYRAGKQTPRRGHIVSCSGCQRKFARRLDNRHTTFGVYCTAECYARATGHGRKRPIWLSGKFDKSGYLIKRFQVGGKVRDVPVHRLVMEQILGRKLLKTENVHHINGIKWDNRPENLELWTRAQPAGIRAADAEKRKHCPTCNCEGRH